MVHFVLSMLCLAVQRNAHSDFNVRQHCFTQWHNLSCQMASTVTQAWSFCAQCTALGDVDVDVSINDDRGIRAARWLVRCQEQWPALRPLTLLLKAVLRVLELHDVSQGQLCYG